MKKSIAWIPVSEWVETRTEDQMIKHGTMETGLLLWSARFGVAKDGLYNFYTECFEINENGKQWKSADITHFAYINEP